MRVGFTHSNSLNFFAPRNLGIDTLEAVHVAAAGMGHVEPANPFNEIVVQAGDARVQIIPVDGAIPRIEDRTRPRPSVELPIIRHGRAEWGVSHVWHATRACHGHPHERPRHARIAPLVACVILGLGVDVLGPRRIMLEGRDRPYARSVHR